MIATAFDNSRCTGVSHAESFRRDTSEIRFPGCCSVESYVADDDVLFRNEGHILWRIDDQTTARQSLAGVVIRITFDFDGDAVNQPCTNALTGRSLCLDMNRVGWKSVGSVSPADFVAQNCSESAIDVLDCRVDANMLLVLQSRLALLQQFHVANVVQSMILTDRTISLHTIMRLLRWRQNR